MKWEYEPIPRYELIVGGFIAGEIERDADSDQEKWLVRVPCDSFIGKADSISEAQEMAERRFHSNGLSLVKRKQVSHETP